MTSPLSAELFDAAGNRFWVLERFAQGPLAERLAQDWGGLEKARADGLLQLVSPAREGDCGMRIHNRDGSRAEACGNGLRCIAVLAFERGHVDQRDFVVETDAGPRRVSVLVSASEVRRARVELGVAHVDSVVLRIEPGAELQASVVDLGNPHCVLPVEDVECAPVETLGAQLQAHPRFPQGTNVEFVQVTPEGLAVRIWERGVGETLSCGTGVGAAVAAHSQRPESVRVSTRGGTLVVQRTADGALWLEGPVRSVAESRRAGLGAVRG